MYNNFSETGIYCMPNGLTITDHRHFIFKLTHIINKNTNSNIFHLESFDIKEQNIFKSSSSQNKIFLHVNFYEFFNGLSNFLKQVKTIHFLRLDKKDLTSIERNEKKQGLNNLFTIIQNKLNCLCNMFIENKDILNNEYKNMYDFYLLRSAFHICHTSNDQLHFYFRTNDYNQHEIYFLSKNLLNKDFYRLNFDNHTDAINWFFDDYKFFKFIEKVDKLPFVDKDKFKIKSDILDCLDYVSIIDSQKRYFIKDLYKKRQED